MTGDTRRGSERLGGDIRGRDLGNVRAGPWCLVDSWVRVECVGVVPVRLSHVYSSDREVQAFIKRPRGKRVISSWADDEKDRMAGEDGKRIQVSETRTICWIPKVLYFLDEARVCLGRRERFARKTSEVGGIGGWSVVKDRERRAAR